MSEASEENPIPAPIQENTPPDPNCSFYLKMKPLQTLKDAIEALLHLTFNNDVSGIIEADSDGLTISVEDNDNATARLSLKSSGMIEFQNYMPPSSPMVGLSAPLRLISQGFPRDLDGDDDTVVIFHVKGTNRLHFEFETVPPSGTWAEIVEIPDATMFPNAVVFTAMTVPIDDVMQMNDYMSKAKDPSNDTVHVDWKGNRVTFEIGRDKKWEYALEEAKESEKGKIFHGWFNWRYIRFMRDAYFLADDQVTVHFLTAPEQHVLFQFHVAELADLFLLEKAALVLPDLSADTTQN